MIRRFYLLLLLLAPSAGAAPLEPSRFEGLLQGAVDRLYLKAFRHIGDERDFDHGHVLFAPDGAPVAILYHTQELSRGEPEGSPFAPIDPAGRNWLQWLDGGAIENAAPYERRDYPATAAWELFRAERLPELKRHGTVLDSMLDPARVKVDPALTKQLTFTRVACGSPAPASGAGEPIGVRLPTGERVCLALGS